MTEGALHPPAPTGYRLFRGAELVAEYCCPMCSARFCVCFSSAWERAKREAVHRGGSYRIETLDGRVLATTKPALAPGQTGRMSKAARAASTEEIAPGAPVATESLEELREREEGEES